MDLTIRSHLNEQLTTALFEQRDEWQLSPQDVCKTAFSLMETDLSSHPCYLLADALEPANTDIVEHMTCCHTSTRAHTNEKLERTSYC
eukprot:545516-Amphidinium_carterae.1